MTDDSKTCPYCGGTISRGAIACRHCGRDLAAAGREAGAPLPAAEPADPAAGYEALLAAAVANAEEIDTGAVLHRVREHPHAPDEIDAAALARAIQAAVARGDLGLMHVAADAPPADLLRYRETVPLSSISFGSELFLVSRERAEEIVEEDPPLPPPAVA